MSAQASRGGFEIGRVFRRAGGALQHNAGNFALLALVLTGLPSVIQILGFASVARAIVAGGALGPGSLAAIAAGAPLLGVGGLLGLVGNAVLQGAVIYGTAAYLNGRPATMADALSAGLRSFLPLLGFSLLSALGIVVGMLFFLVPGIIMALAWSVGGPAIVYERTGVFGAFSRSADLTRGRRWAILGIAFIYFLVAGIVQNVLAGIIGTAGFGATSAGAALPLVQAIQRMPASALISVVGSVFIAVGAAAVYYELRADREGVGPEALASIFD